MTALTRIAPAATFAFAGRQCTDNLAWLAAGLRRGLEGHDLLFEPAPAPATRLVVNFVDADRPRPFRRRAQATFVAAVVWAEAAPTHVLKAAYPLMIRSLANLLIYVVGGEPRPRVYFVTLEQGCYDVSPAPAEDDGAFFRRICSRLLPLATSTLVIDNRFQADLPAELWQGDAVTQELYWAGQRLDALQLLPAPFPIAELLPQRDLRHVQRLYGIGGLSYGNLSARKDGSSFWMSASGVNKADLSRIGRDILLVSGYDRARNAMVLRVPPAIEPRRVSVDAIEHWLIYREHPGVGAIVHVHAWMDGVASTTVNYPCGTLELAEAVSDLVRAAPDPNRAVVGLKNHGLTITGPNLRDIFARIEGRIQRQVPMT